jgi:hypothetical protein
MDNDDPQTQDICWNLIIARHREDQDCHDLCLIGKAQQIGSLFILTIKVQQMGTLKWPAKVQQIGTPIG